MKYCCTDISYLARIRPIPMGKRRIIFFFEFQRYPPEFFRTRFLWARLEKKVPNFWKNPKMKNLGPMLGRCLANIGFRKTQADLWFEAARFRVLDRHRSTKATTASCIQNRVRSLGAPTHHRVTVFTPWPVSCGGS